jgi:hypothetical protein
MCPPFAALPLPAFTNPENIGRIVQSAQARGLSPVVSPMR